MYVIIVSGVVVRLSHMEPKVSGWNPASYPFFFLLSFSSFFFFRFCSVLIVYFLLLLFLKYIHSRAKIVYFRINNLNFYRFPQFTFLFYCNIFYKPKTVVTCSHRLPFIYLFKCDLNLNAGFFFPLNLFPRRLRAVSLWAKRETRKWSCAWLMARDRRGTKKKSSLSFFFSGCRPRVARLAAWPLPRAYFPLKKKTDGVAGRDEVWDREAMFSQLAKRSPRVVVSG